MTMTSSLRADLSELVARHVARMPTPRVLSLLEQYCEDEPPVEPEARPAFDPLTKIDTHGVRLPKDASDWVAVYDSRTKLYWTRRVLDCGAVNWQRAMDACQEVRLLDAADWRAPTIREQLSIIDYERVDPALDTTYFDGEYGWTWTSTIAKGLSGYAWGVLLSHGLSFRNLQGFGLFVRAVRAGQPLELGL